MRNKDKRIRIDSSEVQGDGSFVIVRSPSWGLLRKAQKMTNSGADAATVGIEFAEELVRETVLDWNWTDDADQPLPKPADDKAVIERLTAEEVSFLIEKVTGLVSAGASSGN